MTKHEAMFDGTLGTWNAEPYNIELIKDAKPYHAKAFPVPRIHQQTMRSEVERLCEVGVLRKVNRSSGQHLPTLSRRRMDPRIHF
jgi:hypothetical protein